MSESASGRVLIGLGGTSVSPEEEFLLRHPATGGVVLFTRNYANREQLTDLTASIRKTAQKELLITVDHEGGRVQRFREGFTRLPALAVLGRVFDEHPEKARDLAYRHGRVMATELLLCGVDMSFAPVLDLDRESCVIGDRAFSANPAGIIQMGGHYLAGMHDAGMKTCGKHFPGHGSVQADSHVDNVCDARLFKEIEKHDIEPFRALLNGLDSMMMAHVVYPSVDDRPAGYSPVWIGEYLRGKLGFGGIVFSDDLGMHAAAFAGKLFDRMQRSLEAGCDAVLVCQPEAVKELYAGLDDLAHDTKNGLSCLSGRNMHTAEELAMVGEWRHWQQSLELLEKSQWA
jgi:beta-N-acetylhexosaminidase